MTQRRRQPVRRLREGGRRLWQWLSDVVTRATIAASLGLGGPAWIYGLRDGRAGNAEGARADGVIGDVLRMAKAGWDEAKLPIVVFLVLGIALAAQRHRRGHDDAKDEIKGKAIAIVLAIFAFPLAY